MFCCSAINLEWKRQNCRQKYFLKSGRKNGRNLNKTNKKMDPFKYSKTSFEIVLFEQQSD